MRLHPCSITFLFNKLVTSSTDSLPETLPSKVIQRAQYYPLKALGFPAPWLCPGSPTQSLKSLMQPRLLSNPRSSCLSLMSAVIKEGNASVPGLNYLLRQIQICVKE